METDYSNLPYKDLRRLFLNNQLKHDYMSEPVYELLLDNEAMLDRPSPPVLEFCVAGLAGFDKYKGLAGAVIYGGFVAKHAATDRANAGVPVRTVYRRKRGRSVAIAIVAIVGVLIIGTITAAAFGYNIVDLVRKSIKTPDEVVTDNRIVGEETDKNIGAVFTEGTRIYNSMSEMLENEKFNIFYPTKLPNGYNFTNFEVFSTEMGLQVQMFAQEPYISFAIMLNSNNQIENYIDEINGIKYNVSDMEDGLYVAEWIHGSDYYTVVASDKAILSEIINNLQESRVN